MSVALSIQPNDDTFGSYLRILRRRARLTQTDLSIAVGYSVSHISMLENGQRLPNISAIAALFALALGIERDQSSANRLMELAKRAQQSAPLAEVVNPLVDTTAQLVSHTIEQQISRQTLDAALVEEIPRLPVYAVARPEVMQRLQDRLACERVVALLGLPGMGKSTVAAAFAHHHARAGDKNPVFWLTCSPQINDSLDAILHQLAFFLVANGSNPAQLGPFFPTSTTSETQPQPQSLGRQLAALSVALAEFERVLLVFDDAHVIGHDPQIMPVLARLLSLAPSCRAIFVTRAELNLPGLSYLVLGGLEHDEAFALLEKLYTRPCSPELAERLVLQTAGSPILLRMAVNQLGEQRQQDDGAIYDSFSSYLVNAVLKRLPTSAWWTLAFLSIWRGAVNLQDVDLAATIAEAWPTYDHAAAVAALHQQRLVDSTTQALPHSLLREPMLAQLSARPSERQRLHHVAAQWATAQNDLLEAAHHFCQAGALARACDLVAEEGETLCNQGKSTAAVSVVDEMLDLAQKQLRGNERNARCAQLQILRGDLLVNTQRVAEAQASYRQAMLLLEKREEQVQVAERLAESLLRSGAAQEALELCEQALALLGKALTPSALHLRLQFSNARVRALIKLARFAEARQLCEQAIDATRLVRFIYPALFDRVRGYAYLGLGYTARLQGNHEEARQFLHKAAQHASTIRLRAVESESLSYLSSTLRDLGDFFQAEEVGQRAFSVAQASTNTFQAANAMHFLSIMSYYRYDLNEALQRSQWAKAARRQMGDVEGVGGCEILEALVKMAAGELAEAQCLLDHTLQQSQFFESRWMVGVVHFIRGTLLTYQGELVEGETALQAALACPGFRADVRFRVDTEAVLGMNYVAQGKLVCAQTLAERAVPPGIGFSVELSVAILRGMVHYARGEMAAMRTVAQDIQTRARTSGCLIYAVEAKRLARLTEHAVALCDLPRFVCCHSPYNA